jgi:hypothetical protein
VTSVYQGLFSTRDEVGHISKSDDTALNMNISHHVYALPGIVILDEPIIFHNTEYNPSSREFPE